MADNGGVGGGVGGDDIGGEPRTPPTGRNTTPPPISSSEKRNLLLQRETGRFGTPPRSPVERRSRNVAEQSFSDAWLARSAHFFVVTEAGKPVFTRFGAAEDLAALSGVLQVVAGLVAADASRDPTARDGNKPDADPDALAAIVTGDRRFVFEAAAGGALLCVGMALRTTPDHVVQVQLGCLRGILGGALPEAVAIEIFAADPGLDVREAYVAAEAPLEALLADAEALDPALSFGSLRQLPLGVGERAAVDDAFAKVGTEAARAMQGLFLFGPGRTLVASRQHRGWRLPPRDMVTLSCYVAAVDFGVEAGRSVQLAVVLGAVSARAAAGLWVGNVAVGGWRLACVLLDPDNTAGPAVSAAEAVRRALAVACGATTGGVLHKAVARGPDGPWSVGDLGLAGLRHFAFHSLVYGSLLMPSLAPFYERPLEARDRLAALYASHCAAVRKLAAPSGRSSSATSGESTSHDINTGHGRLTAASFAEAVLDGSARLSLKSGALRRATRVVFSTSDERAVMTSATPTFELVAVLDPGCSARQAVTIANRLLDWVMLRRDEAFGSTASRFWPREVMAPAADGESGSGNGNPVAGGDGVPTPATEPPSPPPSSINGQADGGGISSGDVLPAGGAAPP